MKRKSVPDIRKNLKKLEAYAKRKGALVAKYYYIHAVDYDRGGEWAGTLYMCTDDKSFTIRDTKDCVKRGYKRTGFFEVDTGEERDWTVKLTDPDNEPKPEGEPKPQ